MTDLHTVLPPPGRTNTTPLLDDHPDDHNAIVDAINDLADAVDIISAAAQYRTYATVTARDADTAAHVEGMLSWAASERQLAVWHGEWQIISMPFTVFTPRLFIGTTELAPVGPPPAYQTGFKLNYGTVQFSIGHRFGDLPDIAGTSLVCVVPPVLPDGQGGFGNAYVTDLGGLGSVGGMGGVYDSTASPAGATGRLSIAMPGTGGLMKRSDLGATGGEIDVFMNGTFTTAQYALP